MVTCFFGLPGCGKSTFLAMLAQKELKRIARGRSKYERVLTNFYVDGCYKVDYDDLGKYEIENSLILLDELTLFADSRDYKLFTSAKKYFFLMHRHYNCDIVYFTQQWDGIDKKIRDITSDLFYLKKCCSNADSLLLRPFQSFSVALVDGCYLLQHIHQRNDLLLHCVLRTVGQSNIFQLVGY